MDILTNIMTVASVTCAIQSLAHIIRIVMGQFVRAADARQDTRLYVPACKQQQIKGE